MQCEWRRMRVSGSWWGGGQTESQRRWPMSRDLRERGAAIDQITNEKCKVWERKQRGL